MLTLFCQRDFFLPLEKFKTIKIKPEKNPYIRTFIIIIISLFNVDKEKKKKVKIQSKSLNLQYIKLPKRQ